MRALRKFGLGFFLFLFVYFFLVVCWGFFLGGGGVEVRGWSN